MRRSLALLVAATTSLVLVAFLVPLAVLIRSGTAEQAVSEASGQASALALLVATAEREAVELALETVEAGTGHPFTVFNPANPDFEPVLPDQGGTGVVATSVPAEELT